jgi:hypothetical protein
MSADSLHFAGVVLITASAIAIGGVRLLTMIFRREPGTSITRCVRTCGGQVTPTPARW